MAVPSATYLNSLYADTQARLFTIVDKSEKSTLDAARSLSLQLTDIDLTPLQRTGHPSGPRPTVYGLYEAEIKRLDAALQALPSLTDLVIAPPLRIVSAFAERLYLTFLAHIPANCRCLRQLTVKDSRAVLEDVPQLKCLPGLQFIEPLPCDTPRQRPCLRHDVRSATWPYHETPSEERSRQLARKTSA